MPGDGDSPTFHSPSKRFKTLGPTSKGKEKMDSPPLPSSGELTATAVAEEEEEACGICLAGARRSIRVEMDSCDHYFCFVCIMEWARIESRCPFCKLRFRSIRRPPVAGVFPAERVVKVAERDQVLTDSGKLPGQQHTPSWLPVGWNIQSQ